jgi:hypothetical protein
VRFAGASPVIPSEVGHFQRVRLISINPAVGTVVEGGNVAVVVFEGPVVGRVVVADDKDAAGEGE